MTDHPRLSDDALWALEVIAQGLKSDPQYLIGAPYPPNVLQLLAGGKTVQQIEADIESLDVGAEVEALFRDLKTTRDGFGANDNAEKMAYFRVSTSLLEKLVALRERANNVRQIGQFYAEVLSVMESVLTPAQVGGVRERLMAKMGTGV